LNSRAFVVEEIMITQPAASSDPSAMQRQFQLDPARGFLPAIDPSQVLPLEFSPWDTIARDLPKLLVSDRLRPALDRLPILDPAPLRDAQLARAMMLLSYMGHAYVWGADPPADHLPPGVAVPWYQASQMLGRPPVLSYESYALSNWRRIDPAGPIALGNIALLQNFLGGIDEEWFVLVHVDIEAKAAPALPAIPAALHGVAKNLPELVTDALRRIAQASAAMYQTLLRMPEHCDPYIYYHRVRPYLYGWKDQPALPHGLLYHGVEAYEEKPQMFRGETGAQSSIIPSLDALLGIAHQKGPLYAHLMEMRDYMPPAHRAFIHAIESGPSLRTFVLEHYPEHASLREAYNDCVQGVELFRQTHLEYAAKYIQQQHQTSAANPHEVGTGGTPFMPYLKSHLEESKEHRI
jgi:indoleamine 2,3-dioxygenase